LRAGKWSELETLMKIPLRGRIPARTHENAPGAPGASVTPAVAVLRELRALSGGSPNIFPSPEKGDCMSNNTMLYAIYRMG